MKILHIFHLLAGAKCAALYLTMSQEGQVVDFQARSLKFCMIVALDKALKYRLVRGVEGGGFRGVRGGSCTKIAITQPFFEPQSLNFA